MIGIRKNDVPQNVYDAVLKWASETYGFDLGLAARPFTMAAEAGEASYPLGSVVVDRPDFSDLARVIKEFVSKSQKFFLFAPTLTCFASGRDLCNYVITDATLTYTTGEKVRTSFVTNLGEFSICTDPRLDSVLTVCEETNTHRKVRKLQGVDYPVAVATAANVSAIARKGIVYRVRKGSTKFISTVGEEKQQIFGGGMLLSVAAAEEKEYELRAAEAMNRQTRKVIELSSHDRFLQRTITGGATGSSSNQMDLFQ